MLKVCFLFFAIIFCISVCGQKFEQQDGLWYEVPDSANLKNKDFFNLDNNIYIPGREFFFTYQLIKNGDTLRVRVNHRNDTKTQNWSFFKNNEEDSLTISYLSFKVKNGYGGLDALFPEYSQTIIQQNYYSFYREILFDGSTGIIENEKNIWMHTFRGKYFSVLEFSPFPFFALPARAGKEWTWKLNDISERWSDPRIIEYQGKQSAAYHYKIVGKKKVTSPLGTKECYVTEATAITSLGSTKLISYFNSEYGFMQLDYTNVDGSTIELKLADVKNYR